MEYVFVRVENNIARLVDVTHLRTFLVDFMLKQDPKSLFNGFEDKLSTLTSDLNLGLLKEVNIEFFQDARGEVHIFYQNKILKIVKGAPYQYIEYENFNCVIWESSIIKRDCPTTIGFAQSEFVQFMNHCFPGIAQQKQARQAIGYIISSFRDRSFCPAVIVTDNNSGDAQQGGTGKGIITQALSKYINIASENGKKFDAAGRFCFQSVGPDTRCIVVEDVLSSFQFELLFKSLSDGLGIEQKNKTKIEFTFEESPKFVLTTNFAIPGSDESHKRRRVDLFISDHYSASFSPFNQFGHLFFSEWETGGEQWEQFDAFMAACVQTFIDTGLQRVANDLMSAKQLSAATHPDFQEFLDSDLCTRDIKIPKSEMLKNWNGQHANGRSKISIRQITAWLIKYEKICGYTLENNQRESYYRLIDNREL